MADAESHRSQTIAEMMQEEPEIDLTPMIDVVFLMLIFFMCMKFKSYEKKLDSELPRNEGPMRTLGPPIQQLRINLKLVPGTSDQVNILPDPMNEAFQPIAWSGDPRQMFLQLEQQMEHGYPWIGDKVEVAPEPDVPFDYVAMTLDAFHAARQEMEGPWPENRAGTPPYPDKGLRVTFMAAGPQGVQ